MSQLPLLQTTILAVESNIEDVTTRLRQANKNLINCIWKIQLNGSNSTHINFIYKKVQPLPLIVNRNVRYVNKAKYLGISFNYKLNEHIKTKITEFNVQTVQAA